MEEPVQIIAKYYLVFIVFCHCSKEFTHVFAFNLHIECIQGINLLIFDIMKLRHGKAKELGQDHQQEEDQDLNLTPSVQRE